MSAEKYEAFKARHLAKGINGNGHGEILGPVTASWLAGSAWPTPAARDEKGPNADAHRASRERAHDDQLPNAAIAWATPNTAERGAFVKNPERGGGQRDLMHDAVNFPSSRPAEATNQTLITPTGALGLLLQHWHPPQCRALNPVFQQWLMGWPVRMNSESAEMAWSRWRRLMRSRLSLLLSCGERAGAE